MSDLHAESSAAVSRLCLALKTGFLGNVNGPEKWHSNASWLTWAQQLLEESPRNDPPRDSVVRDTVVHGGPRVSFVAAA